jgi:hypothetical protein
LQGLLDAYIADLKVKRQKLREKRKPSKTNAAGAGGNTNQAQGDPIDDEDFGAEDEMEEDDDDDADDYDYIEDKLLSQNSTSVVGGASTSASGVSGAISIPGQEGGTVSKNSLQ